MRAFIKGGLISVIFAVVLFGAFVFIMDWCEWGFLFIYQSYFPRIILIIVLLVPIIFLVIRKLHFKEDLSQIKIALGKICVIIISFLAIYSITESILRTIFYKTASQEFHIVMKVTEIGGYRKSRKMILINKDSSIIKWNELFVWKNIKEKPDVELLASSWIIENGDSIIIYGRQNIFGFAIDKLERIECNR